MDGGKNISCVEAFSFPIIYSHAIRCFGPLWMKGTEDDFTGFGEYGGVFLYDVEGGWTVRPNLLTGNACVNEAARKWEKGVEGGAGNRGLVTVIAEPDRFGKEGCS